MHDRYFDYTATTPVDQRVIDEMLPYLTEFPGNAASIHGYGFKAKQAVKLARQRVANLIQAQDPLQITFCSGATEANNWVLSGFEPDKTAVSPYEHASLLNTACLRGQTVLPPFTQVLPTGFDLVATMAINNEIGSIFNIADLRARTKAKNMLVDATQAIGKVPFCANENEYVSCSGHKFYAPKGIGFLYQKNVDLPVYLVGGGQEFGRRGGTLNIPGIVAIGAAAQIAIDEIDSRMSHAESLRNLAVSLLEGMSDTVINTVGEQSPYILSISFAGLVGETLLIELDRQGFCVSAGSACSSGKTATSPVLRAFGVADSYAGGTIRISFGKWNTQESTTALCCAITESVEKLRKLRA